MKRIIPLALGALLVALLMSYGISVLTARAATGHVGGLSFYLTPYALGPWPDVAGPYVGDSSNCTRNTTGICVVIINGKTYDQPVTQALDGLVALAYYQTSKRSTYLARAELEANHLISIHVRSQANLNAWWYPYRFDYHEYNGLLNPAPWYSGMAQGRALELFTELYTATGDTKWKDAADHTFASFLMPPSSTWHPWVIHTSGSWLWIEEYPTPNANDHTMNGFGFAIYGLIAYARTFRSPQATLLAQGALSTFLYAARVARHPGGPSAYSLSELWYRPANYHKVVTTELKIFAAVTHASSFATMAAAYYSDFHLGASAIAVANQP